MEYEDSTVGQYQAFVDSTRKPGGKLFPGFYPITGLAAEAGEVLEIMQKRMRKGEGTLTEEDKIKIADELGDVLWYAAALCNDLGFHLEDIITDNMVKLNERAKQARQ